MNAVVRFSNLQRKTVTSDVVVPEISKIEEVLTNNSLEVPKTEEVENSKAEEKDIYLNGNDSNSIPTEEENKELIIENANIIVLFLKFIAKLIKSIF